jgi:hypothetical protein
MNRKNPTCIDCRCGVISHTIERHGRQLTMEETIFSCGSRLKQSITANGNVGKVEFIGCNCAS